MHAAHVNQLMWLSMQMHIPIFESLQPEGSYVGQLLYFILIKYTNYYLAKE